MSELYTAEQKSIYKKQVTAWRKEQKLAIQENEIRIDKMKRLIKNYKAVIKLQEEENRITKKSLARSMREDGGIWE